MCGSIAWLIVVKARQVIDVEGEGRGEESGSRVLRVDNIYKKHFTCCTCTVRPTKLTFLLICFAHVSIVKNCKRNLN